MHSGLIDVQVHTGRHNLRRGMLELFYGTPNVRRVTRSKGCLAALKFAPRKWYRLWEEIARRIDKWRNDKTTAKQSTVRDNRYTRDPLVCVTQILSILSDC